ncbi:Uncharacterised protein [Shigella sonnei]|nr:Uncharacterised protein [Shigella sonnei]CSQ69694.1 Uncharacterised protein [Shigella sonnei]CSQ83588.1 Uncharacterised protein [Shigella sonnei]
MPKNSAWHLHIKQHMTGDIKLLHDCGIFAPCPGLIIHRPLTKIVGDIIFKFAG